MKFTYDYGKIYVDGRLVEQSEIIDILLKQQKEINSLQEEVSNLHLGKIKRTYEKVCPALVVE